MKVAVAGGTGVVGTHLVEQLRARGHDVLVLSRASGFDLTSAPGAPALREAFADVDAVVDVTSTATSSARTATRFFTTTSRALLDAGAAAGVRHHVLLSIVGIDTTPFGYYLGKVAQEQEVTGSGVPFSIVRAPQFHEFAAQMVERTSLGPLTVVPRMLAATMAAEEVARVLADVAEGEPQGRTGDLRGPETAQMPDLVRRLLRHRGEKRRVVAVRLPGRAGKQMVAGALVADDPWITGTQTFDAWLAEQPGAVR